MNGNSFLADTNAFIYLLDKHPGLEALLEHEWYFSFITEIELLSKPNLKENDINIVKDVLKTATKVVHRDEIDEMAIDLRRSISIKTPDAIIAATALCLGIPLITADKGFSKVNDLDLILIEP